MAVSPTIILAIIGGAVALFGIILLFLVCYLLYLKRKNSSKEDEYNKVPRKSTGNGVSIGRRTIEQANRRYAREIGNPMYDTQIAQDTEPVLRDSDNIPEHRNPPPYIVETIPGGSRVIINANGTMVPVHAEAGSKEILEPSASEQGVKVVTNEFTTHAPPGGRSEGQSSNPESEISLTSPRTDDEAGILANEYPIRSSSQKSSSHIAESYIRPTGYVHLNEGQNETKVRGDWGPLNTIEARDWSAKNSEIGTITTTGPSYQNDNWGQLNTLDRMNSSKRDYMNVPEQQSSNWGQMETLDRPNVYRVEYANSPDNQNAGQLSDRSNYGQLNTIERQTNENPRHSYQSKPGHPYENTPTQNHGTNNVIYQNNQTVMQHQEHGVLIHVD